jgi:hypothetical protein
MTISDRNAIDALRRYEGMPVYVVENSTWYQLRGGIANTDWVDAGSGGGGGGGGGGGITFKINGPLSGWRGNYSPADGAHVGEAFVPSKVTAVMNQSGNANSLVFDIRKTEPLNINVTAFNRVVRLGVSSLPFDRMVPALAIADIAVAQNPPAVIDIDFKQAPINLLAIRTVGNSQISEGYTAGVDDVFLVHNTSFVSEANGWIDGAWVELSGFTAAGNNGRFKIEEVSVNGTSRVIRIKNPSAVQALSSPVGDVKLCLFAFQLDTTPRTDVFVVGELVRFAGTAGPNTFQGTIAAVDTVNDILEIYCDDVTGATDPSPSQTAVPSRFLCNASAIPSPQAFVIGEEVDIVGATETVFNGRKKIVNTFQDSDDNIVIYVPDATVLFSFGTITALTNRLRFGLASGPNPFIGNAEIGDMVGLGFINDTEFVAKAVRLTNLNFSGLDVCIYNPYPPSFDLLGMLVSMLDLVSTRVVLNVDDIDVASKLSAGDLIKFKTRGDNTLPLGLSTSYTQRPLEVVYVGGAYEVHIDVPIFDQSYTIDSIHDKPARVQLTGWGGFPTESGSITIIQKQASIFNSPPELVSQYTLDFPEGPIFMHSTDFVSGLIPEDTVLQLYIDNVPEGTPRDLTVTLVG